MKIRRSNGGEREGTSSLYGSLVPRGGGPGHRLSGIIGNSDNSGNSDITTLTNITAITTLLVYYQ